MVCALICAMGASLSAPAAHPNLPPCEDSAYCNFHRPEDITPIPGTPWIVVSQAPPGSPLQLVDTSSPARRVAATYSETPPRPPITACTAPPGDIHPRGHGIGRFNGQLTLALINGSPQNRIELFDVNTDGDDAALTWSGCVPVPASLLLNDVVIGPHASLYASHMFDPPVTPQGQADLGEAFKARKDTGYAARWDTASGWSKVRGTDVSFANGIALTGNGNTLVIAGTYSQAVKLVDLQTGAVTAIPLPLQPDNISPVGDGQFLVAGHTGTPLTGVNPCRSAAALPCGFPFAVVRFDTSGARTTVFIHDGSSIPGASVAAIADGGKLFLGSAFGDRITVIELAGRL